ncbi:hypothetical protein SAMD00019534_021600 [Acytostelium subglobosum LB1]|uniref:hypothetical protein n=1 Tax=Acytostelium subglobosum LB1 TaxID=1410327 RepID=UPI00064508E1|nr:hypothetical protein SAMD00019534_021600 [Acytostelium subglobosum LB1]GAM18985.1 hypothetical protein SAMD00019534_021600 [Acytostelium subglobosum LB1]|eukprot:XP_012756912.1 hypothetical protein SAMD00019534_021600 [Acytostelium subglobosum LB1]
MAELNPDVKSSQIYRRADNQLGERYVTRFFVWCIVNGGVYASESGRLIWPRNGQTLSLRVDRVIQAFREYVDLRYPATGGGDESTQHQTANKTNAVRTLCLGLLEYPKVFDALVLYCSGFLANPSRGSYTRSISKEDLIIDFLVRYSREFSPSDLKALDSKYSGMDDAKAQQICDQISRATRRTTVVYEAEDLSDIDSVVMKLMKMMYETFTEVDDGTQQVVLREDVRMNNDAVPLQLIANYRQVMDWTR